MSLGGFILILSIVIYFTAVAIRVTAVGFLCVLAFDAVYHRSTKTLSETARVGSTAIIASIIGAPLLGFVIGLLMVAALVLNHLLSPNRPLRFSIIETFQDRKSMDVAVSSFCLSPGRAKRIRPFVLLGFLASITSMYIGLAVYTSNRFGNDATNAPMRSVVISLLGGAVLGCGTWFSKEQIEEAAIQLRPEEPQEEVHHNSVSETLV